MQGSPPTCIAQYGENNRLIQLSSVFRSVIGKLARILSFFSEKSDYHLNSKRILIHNLLQAKVSLAKLLVLLRYQPLCQINLPSLEMTNYRALNTSSYLQQILSTFRQYFIPPFNFQVPQILLPPTKPVPIPQSTLIFISAIRSELPRRIKRFAQVGSNAVFIAPSYYMISVFFREEGIVGRSRIWINWPDSIQINRSQIKAIISKLKAIEFRDQKAVERLDSILFSAYLSGQMAAIVLELSKASRKFNIQITSKSGIVFLIFPNSFRPFNRFSIEVSSERIFLRSLAPLFMPSKQLSASNDQAFRSRQFLSYVLELQGFDPYALLTDLRDAVLFTRTLNLQLQLQKITIKSFIPKASVNLVPSKFSYAVNSISAEAHEIHFFSIKFDSKDGSIQLEHELPYIIDGLTQAQMEGEAGLSSYYRTIMIAFFLSKAYSSLFGLHILPFIRSFSGVQMQKVALRFSFAADFFLLATKSGTDLTFDVQSLISNQTSHTFQTIMFKSVKKPAFMKHIPKVLYSAKLLAIFLQLQQKLLANGIQSFRFQNSIIILTKPMTFSMFKIQDGDCWSLKIFKGNYPIFARRSVYICGHSFSSRFVDSIVLIIFDIIRLSSTEICLGTQSMSGLRQIGDCISVARFKGYQLFIKLGPLHEEKSDDPDQEYYLASASYQPMMRYFLSRTRPIILNTQIIPQQTFINSCNSFFQSFLPKMLEIVDMFSPSDDWTISAIGEDTLWQLVYRRVFSISFLFHSYRSLEGFLPSKGPTTIAFRSLTTIKAKIDRKSRRFFLAFSELPSFKETIEKDYQLFNDLRELGLNDFSIEDDSVICKGSSQYKVILKESMLLIDSSAYPEFNQIKDVLPEYIKDPNFMNAYASMRICKPVLLSQPAIGHLFLKFALEILKSPWIKSIDVKKTLENTVISNKTAICNVFLYESGEEPYIIRLQSGSVWVMERDFRPVKELQIGQVLTKISSRQEKMTLKQQLLG